ncbi:MAG: hypothetical protein MJ052_05595, partial [Sphaerochaetaceae bacterium]|nr:hypothetical protein [Sphaerochaetaceae bacterium]
MKNSFFSKKIFLTSIVCVLIMSASSVALAATLKAYTSLKYLFVLEKYREGQIADDDVIVSSAIDVIDVKATETLKNFNKKRVLPEFIRKTASMEKTYRTYRIFVDAVTSSNWDSVLSMAGQNLGGRIKEVKNLKALLACAFEQMSDIYSSGLFSYDDIKRIKNEGYDKLEILNSYSDSSGMGQEVLGIGSVLTEKDVFSYVMSKLVLDFQFSDVENDIVADIVTTFISPNIFYDAEATDFRRLMVYENTSPVVIHFEKGERILEKDTVVTAEELNNLKVLAESKVFSVSEIFGNFAVNAFSIGFLLFVFWHFLKDNMMRGTLYLWILTCGVVISCLLAFFAIVYGTTGHTVSFMLCYFPVGLVPILITMITSKKSLGLVASAIMGVIVSTLPGALGISFFYSTAIGAVGVNFVRLLNKRLDMLLQWLYTTVTICFVTTFFMIVILLLPV